MDLARAKGKALVNMLIIYSNEKYNRVMLNDVGNEKEKKQQQHQLCTCSTPFCTFIYRCSPFSVRILFFSAAHFHLAGLSCSKHG